MGLKSLSDGVGSGLKKVTDLNGMGDKLKDAVNLDKFKKMASSVTDVSKLAELNTQMINELKKAGGDMINKVVGDEERMIIDEETESAQEYKQKYMAKYGVSFTIPSLSI